jgi:hypothetical protein
VNKPHRSVYDGQTNATHMAVHCEVLGGPMVVGELYRIRVMQGVDGQGKPRRPSHQAIVEFAGEGPDPIASQETAYRFIIRNPPLPLGAKNGTREAPSIVWPIDLASIAHAEPGDLEVPMAPGIKRGPIDAAIAAQPEGRPPTRSA